MVSHSPEEYKNWGKRKCFSASPDNIAQGCQWRTQSVEKLGKFSSKGRTAIGFLAFAVYQGHWGSSLELCHLSLPCHEQRLDETEACTLRDLESWPDFITGVNSLWALHSLTARLGLPLHCQQPPLGVCCTQGCCVTSQTAGQLPPLPHLADGGAALSLGSWLGASALKDQITHLAISRAEQVVVLWACVWFLFISFPDL